MLFDGQQLSLVWYSHFRTSIKNYPGQRPINIERVNELETKLFNNWTTKKNFGLRHPFYVGVYNGINYLIDGQHRFYALEKLMTKVPEFQVLVSYITCSDLEELHHEFCNINNVTPMLEIYINPSDTIKTVMETMGKRFANIKTGSMNRKRPNVSSEFIASSLVTCISSYKLTAERLWTLMLMLEEGYSKWTTDEFSHALGTPKGDLQTIRLWAQIKESNLSWLGMFTTKHSGIWINHIIYLLQLKT